MATARWITNVLEGNRIEYHESHHPWAVTASELAEYERVPGRRVAKVVLVMADGKPVVLVLPADRRVDFHRARQVLDTRDVRKATEAELAQVFPDSELGAEPPLPRGFMDVWVDESLRTGGEILFAGGTHEDAVSVRFQDWLRLVEPKMAHFVETPIFT